MRRHRIRRRQAALHGASGAPRPQMECPQQHRATNHCLIQWRITELYSAQWCRRRRRCREDCVFCVLWGFSYRVEVQQRQHCCQPGGLARRFWGKASAHDVPATSLRNDAPPNHMARHRTLRRAMASASPKMPRRRVFLGFLGLSVGPCPDLLTTNAHKSEGNSSFNSFARVRCRHIWRWPLTVSERVWKTSQQFQGVHERVPAHALLTVAI